MQAKKQNKVLSFSPRFSMFHKENRGSSCLSKSKRKKQQKTQQKSTKKQRNPELPFHRMKTEKFSSTQNDYGFYQQSKVCSKIIETKKDHISPQKNNVFSQIQKKCIQSSSSRRKLFKKCSNSKERETHDSSKTKKTRSPFVLKKINSLNSQKSPQLSSDEWTMDTRSHIKTSKNFQSENQYYQGLYLSSQQQIQKLRKAAENEKKKCERVKQIYKEKIRQLNSNKQACQKNLGHIFSYENPSKDILPEQIIVENSVECSREQSLVRSRMNSDFMSSKLSINSRQF